ncbi:hypothetical protein WISP_94909 [Willisornis vidua]|uniref:Uncharacterized protein n=1 Tax=Willisornis vidua TaxID=1566151 RepID=A0ABQ9D0F6_9PASS|nr:hypothetical protein WISP_94909 [Willisornis vidua]
MRFKSSFYHSLLFESKSLQVSSESRVPFSRCAKLTFAASGPGIPCSPGLGSRLSCSQCHVLFYLESTFFGSNSNSSSFLELDQCTATKRSDPRTKEEEAL